MGKQTSPIKSIIRAEFGLGSLEHPYWIELQCRVTPMRQGCVVLSPPPNSSTPIPQHPPYLPFPRTNFNNKADRLDEMDPTARQDPVISITNNCGNVTDSYNQVWNNCDISIADEKRAVLEWLSPLEPRERHQVIGMDRIPGVGDWLLITNEFTQWNQGGDGTANPVLFCYGDPGVGKTYLRYG